MSEAFPRVPPFPFCYHEEEGIEARDHAMRKRSRSREVALQLLFLRDQNHKVTRAAIEQFVRDRLKEPDARLFCLMLFDGARERLGEIDKKIGQAAENWRLSRMSTVDRNVLRLAAYEVLFEPETPDAVAFDEAIELARRFGTADSPAFVNGVLDRLRREAKQPEEKLNTETSEPAE